MPRCSECKRFVSLTETEPEVDDMNVDEDGNLTVSIHIMNACAECGQELTEATFLMEDTIDPLDITHLDTCTQKEMLDVEMETAERTIRTEGRGRGAKTFYGVTVVMRVFCMQCDASVSCELGEEIQASAMEILT